MWTAVGQVDVSVVQTRRVDRRHGPATAGNGVHVLRRGTRWQFDHASTLAVEASVGNVTGRIALARRGVVRGLYTVARLRPADGKGDRHVLVSRAVYGGVKMSALPQNLAARLRDLGSTCNEAVAALLQAEAWERAATQAQEDSESAPNGPPYYLTRFTSQLADVTYGVVTRLTVLYTQYATVYACTATALYAPDIGSAPIVVAPTSAPRPGDAMSNVDELLPDVDLRTRRIAASLRSEVATSRAAILDAVEQFRRGGGSHAAFDGEPGPPAGQSDIDLTADIACALHWYAAALVAAFEQQTG